MLPGGVVAEPTQVQGVPPVGVEPYEILELRHEAIGAVGRQTHYLALVPRRVETQMPTDAGVHGPQRVREPYSPHIADPVAVGHPEERGRAVAADAVPGDQGGPVPG